MCGGQVAFTSLHFAVVVCCAVLMTPGGRAFDSVSFYTMDGLLQFLQNKFMAKYVL